MEENIIFFRFSDPLFPEESCRMKLYEFVYVTFRIEMALFPGLVSGCMALKRAYWIIRGRNSAFSGISHLLYLLLFALRPGEVIDDIRVGWRKLPIPQRMKLILIPKF